MADELNSSADGSGLPEEIKSLLQNKDIPDQQKQAIIKLFSVNIKSASFSGPIPPPDILEGYNKPVKDGAERVLSMAEDKLRSVIKIEEHAVTEQLRQSRRGQDYGFIIVIACLILTGALALTGHDTVAGIFGSTTIVGLAAVFVIGRKSQDKETPEKK